MSYKDKFKKAKTKKSFQNNHNIYTYKKTINQRNEIQKIMKII